ncbi:DUF6292 family protein [Streptomyces griseiscabiei]|uniref:DUF6292 family protein n=1 Tax=Streptomyces griseiscabiei TaxID=2993540 RepID=A0ABU4KYH5_9ACTN|nr:DUF6292 family protein [Streptomyces griseiscabiei]MBZ3904398.1 hypothetical protein [Streptomyces griseiscabiei]MDX2908145.1 DUF6292 family protein [Streptomyces griseiscabiei]
MPLHPPGLLPYELLPHWPYARAVDQALTERGIPPGAVRVERTGREHGETMYLVLGWDISRTVRPAGIRLTWKEDSGWAYAFLGPCQRILPAAPSPRSAASTRCLTRSPKRLTPLYAPAICPRASTTRSGNTR